MNHVFRRAFVALVVSLVSPLALTAQIPHLVEQDGRHALFVDGKPFLILGAQIHNSSAWPETLQYVWQAANYLQVNTIEAPVYWEQIEQEPGKFDFSNVDALIDGAREHNVRLVLLWFGTWKNARNHYTPEWVKNDPVKYPRLIDANGRRTDSMSPFGETTLHADCSAFAALMRHLKQIDEGKYTVIMVQVENESGSLDSVRDFSEQAQKVYSADVPPDLVQALHLQRGSWQQVFGNSAAEHFQAWSVARYIDRVAAAGKAEYPLPMYVNVWVRSPDDLEGEGPRSYPSGGAVDTMLDLWKATVHSIDMMSPDMYQSGDTNYMRVMDAYTRADNPLFVPENSHDPQFARYIFRVLGNGGIGYSVWGVDSTNVTSEISPAQVLPFDFLAGFKKNYEMLGSMQRELASLNFAGKVKTVLEDEPFDHRRMTFGKWQAIASFGVREEGEAQGPAGPHGVLLVAQLSDDEFLVTGFDARIEFHLTAPGKDERWQIMRVEEGQYRNGEWTARRWLNGDECDFGANFGATPQILRFKMGTY